MTKTIIEETSDGNLEITPIFHGSVYLKYKNFKIHIDPWERVDYSSYYKSADLILVTHNHMDHLDVELIDKLSNENTRIICNITSASKLDKYEAFVMKNGDDIEIKGIKIEAVPAYNIVRERNPGLKYHPKGEGNGYILTMGGKKIYIPGDTEATPELESLTDIDVAFVPIRLPYTMSAEEAANVVKKFRPKMVIAYHTGGEPTPKEFYDLLVDEDIIVY